ncbi:PAS domain-containing protein [Pseudomonas sp. dw_358]|uniref:PAS domain-containing protein n=1 Tax=Pseudomonas sp. dw_358 TaxID=2720083 RepID=UPI001BD21B66|nr:PAS domain-containing protein [Pseudomonas sp. dw_358]
MINAQLLQRMIDASNDGIVVAEKEGEDNILIYVNRAFERLTGYSAAEILYRDCRFLQNGQSDPLVLQQLRAAINAGQPSRQVLRNFRKDGSEFWNELSITPVFNEADQLMYYIGIQKDVSEHMAAQRRITALEARLAEALEQIEARQGDERM